MLRYFFIMLLAFWMASFVSYKNSTWYWFYRMCNFLTYIFFFVMILLFDVELYVEFESIFGFTIFFGICCFMTILMLLFIYYTNKKSYMFTKISDSFTNSLVYIKKYLKKSDNKFWFYYLMQKNSTRIDYRVFDLLGLFFFFFINLLFYMFLNMSWL